MDPGHARPLRVHFVNENIGGHATLHRHLRASLADHPEVEADFYDVPPPTVIGRVLRRPIPGLARLDLDFHATRDHLLRSRRVHQDLARSPGAAAADVWHLYTQNIALLSAGQLARHASVVSTDATFTQIAHMLPQRAPGSFTHQTLRATATLERRVFASAEFVVAHTDWAARSIRDDYGVPAAHIRVIPFGIEVPPRPERHPAARPQLVFVGRSLERKGGRWLLDVWRARLRDRCDLVLVTEERLPTEPGLVVRNDVRSGDGKLDAILAAAAVFCFPSVVDTFGYAVIEAMAAGLPVVALAVAGLPEVVENGRTGSLLAPGDAPALVAAIEGYLDAPELAVAAGDAGRRRVEERFDARVTTGLLVGVLADARASWAARAGR